MKMTGRTGTSLSLSAHDGFAGRWSNPGDDDLLARALGMIAELSEGLLLILIVLAHPIWVTCIFLLVFFGSA